VKKILILTAGFGEGHNAAARGVRDGLTRVASGQAEVEMHDLLAETYPVLFNAISRAYLTVVDHLPRAWGIFYQWLEKKEGFDQDFQKFGRLKEQLERLLNRFQPDAVVSVFPPYPYLLDQLLGLNRKCKSVIIVTDSITVSKIWYRSAADYFLVPNQQSATIVRVGGVPPEKIRVFGFPVSPKFADITQDRQPPSAGSRPRVLYMINAGTWQAANLVSKLLDLDIDLTVTVGRNEQLRRSLDAVAGNRKIDIVGWTDQLPKMLCASHLLIGKAGGATVQETIAAGCPMIINHIVSGQEEGNARLIEETNSGVIARSQDEVISQVERAFTDAARQWREWATNVARLSRPRASLHIAEFLLSLE
jgi:processive 1,2-diacylglycerol beta-glucosyltransferase